MTEEKRPDCFGWPNGRDASCKRCKLFKLCSQHSEDFRPACFGDITKYDPNGPCSQCLDQSFCIERLGGEEKLKTLTLRPDSAKVVLKKKKKTAEPPKEELTEEVPVEQPKVEKREDAVDFESSQYYDMSIIDLRTMCDERGLDSKGKKTDIIKRLILSDGGVIAPKPVDPAPLTEELPSLPKPVGEVQRLVVSPDTWATELLVRLHNGQSLIFTKVPEGYSVEFKKEKEKRPAPQMSVQNQEPIVKKDDKARDKACFTEEYYKLRHVDAGHGKPWTGMTQDEKKALCAEAGATYRETSNVPVQAMWMLDAIRKALSIEMYKPEFASKGQREAAGWW